MSVVNGKVTPGERNDTYKKNRRDGDIISTHSKMTEEIEHGANHFAMTTLHIFWLKLKHLEIWRCPIKASQVVSWMRWPSYLYKWRLANGDPGRYDWAHFIPGISHVCVSTSGGRGGSTKIWWYEDGGCRTQYCSS